jgi:hypothetical protein
MSKSRPFAAVIPPKSFTSASKTILEIIHKGWIEIPPEKKFNGNAAPGDFLEHLLGGKRNNRDSPDLNDWEVKFHGGNALLTLFHKEPSPRGVMRLMVHEHGWPDHLERISFRHTLGGKSNRGFYVVNEADRIIVRHSSIDTIVPFWKHVTLINAAAAKLRRLILVEGEMQTSPIKRVKYNSAIAYWEFNTNHFFNALVNGNMYIDFDARTQEGRGSAIRNHGTKFRINIAELPSIYEHSRKIT